MNPQVIDVHVQTLAETCGILPLVQTPWSMLSDVPGPVRRVLLGVLLNFVGSGLTMSLLLVYLTQIRGISAATGGLVLSWMALVGIAMTAPVGALIDRIGPVRVLIPGVALEAVAVSCWSFVDSAPKAFAVASAVAAAGACIWPSQTTLYAQLTPPELRERVFALSFMCLNLGLGLGGLLTSIVIRDGDAARFELLYRLDALTYAFLVIAVWSIRANAQHAHEKIDRSRPSGKYADVLRDRRLQLLALGGVITFICGYGSTMAGMPLFATQEAGLSVRWLGVIYGANTFFIVFAQPYVVTWLRGRSRSAVLASVGAVWALSWMFVGSAVWVLPVLMLTISQIVFAVGEMLWAPVGPALVNDMAPDDMRGRYNAVVGLQWGISGVVGPALTGAMLGADLAWQWLFLMVVGSLIGAATLQRLHTRLDPATDGRVAESSHG